MTTCSTIGHDYTDRLDRPEDGTYGFRVCSCGGYLPGHDQNDPADPAGCGMAWRVCRYCDHIDEHPITDLPADYGHLPTDTRGEVQPSGSLRQDVAAELALPTTGTHTSSHQTAEETPMVERHNPTAGAA